MLAQPSLRAFQAKRVLVVWLLIGLSLLVMPAFGQVPAELVLPVFPSIPNPELAADPLPAERILGDADLASALVSSCRSDPGLIAVHGLSEADRLLRLTAALERGRSARQALLGARAALRRSIEETQKTSLAAALRLGNESFAAWGDDAALLFTASDAWEQLETEVARVWEESWPAAGRCPLAEELVERSVAFATVIEEGDLAAALPERMAVSAILSERLGLLARLGEEKTQLAIDTRRVLEARERLHDAQASWDTHSETVLELLQGYRQLRGLAAAFWSNDLAEIADAIRRAGSLRDILVADTLMAEVVRVREYAANRHPSFVAAHPTFLDTSGLAASAPRRAVAETIVESLRRQLPLLLELYNAHTSREQEIAPLLAGREVADFAQYDAPLAVAWFRLAHFVELLGRSDLSEMERGWVWTRVGKLRDRILTLERLLTSIEEREIALLDAALSTAESGFPAAVANQERLIAEIDTIKLGESSQFKALASYGDEVAQRAVVQLEELVTSASAWRETSRSKAAKRAIVALGDSLSRRLERQRRGLEFGEPVAAIAASMWGVLADASLSFGHAAETFRALPSLERLTGQTEDVRASLRHLADLEDNYLVDEAVLELALALDLPLGLDVTQDTLRIAIGAGELSYVLHHRSLTSARYIPRGPQSPPPEGVFVLASMNSLPRFATTPFAVPASNGGVPFWEQPGTIPPEWQRSPLERIQAFPKAIKDEVAGSWPTYLVAIPLTLFPPTAWIGLPVLGGTILKDALFGSIKGVGGVVLTDPRDIRRWNKAASITKIASDLKDLVKNGGKAVIGRGTAAGMEPFTDLVAGTGDFIKSGAELLGDDEGIPYETRIRVAAAKIKEAYEKARTCTPSAWPQIKELLAEAALHDPHRQARSWSLIGNRVMMLAHTCPDKLAAFGNIDPLPTALAELESDIRACNLSEASREFAEFTSQRYVDVSRCLCRHDYLAEARQFGGPIAVLEKVSGLLSGAEAACEADTAIALAQQVLNWDPELAEYFSCAADYRQRAEAVLQWAQLSKLGGDNLDVAEMLIEECILDDARQLLESVPKARRNCPDPLSQRLAQLTTRLAERHRSDDVFGIRLGKLESTLSDCDVDRARPLLEELEGLEACSEALLRRRSELAAFFHELEMRDTSDDALAFNIEATIELALLSSEICDFSNARTEIVQARTQFDVWIANPCNAASEKARTLREAIGAADSELAAAESFVDRIITLSKRAEAALASCRLDEAGDLARQVIDIITERPDWECAALAGNPQVLLQRAGQLSADGTCKPPSSAGSGSSKGSTGWTPVGRSTTVGSSAGPSGGGSGRVQIGDSETCAQDMSWAPQSQRFVCTCPGYTLDSDLGRCVKGSGSVGGSISSATAAYGRCQFGSAFASAQQAARRQPDHPWVVANLSKIEAMKTRQESTLRSLALAGDALQRGQPSAGLGLVEAAAREAPSCMSSEIAVVADRIRDQMAADRTRRSSDRKAAAGAILGTLVGIRNRATSGHDDGSGGTGPSSGGGTSGSTGGGSTGGGADPDSTERPCVIGVQSFAHMAEGASVATLLVFSEPTSPSPYAPNTYTVYLIPTRLGNPNNPHCSNARTCLKHVLPTGMAYRVLGDYPSQVQAVAAARRHCPNPTSTHGL